MAPRKSKIPSGKKRKIKSKKCRVSKCKPSKRKCKKTVPLKKRQVKKINTCNFNNREVQNSVIDDVCNQKETRSNTDFPLEELYHDDRGTLYSSDLSDEDEYEFDSNQKFLRRKPTSSNESLVQKYIDSGMNHVASFIVESAIRFGQEQGVVIPEKGNKNVYEFVSPYSEDKDKKIRFRIPSKIFGYEDAKKAMWKRRKQKKPLHLSKSVKKIKMKELEKSSSESDLEKTQKKNLKRRKKKTEITDPKSPGNSSTSSNSSIIT